MGVGNRSIFTGVKHCFKLAKRVYVMTVIIVVYDLHNMCFVIVYASICFHKLLIRYTKVDTKLLSSVYVK